jgi:hypothetical protein
MKPHTTFASRLFSGITLTLALTGAGCGFAVESRGPDGPPDDGARQFRTAEGVIRLSTARGTALGGNADGVHGCDDFSVYDHYEHGGITNGTQLHVIGVVSSNEGQMSNAPPYRGPIDVQVNRSGKSVLMLNSYNAVTWNIQVAEGATLDGIVVSSYYESSVNAPEGVPVVKYSFEKDLAIFGDYGYAWPSFHATELVDAAELETGLELTSFRGCAASASFQIDEPGALRPPHQVSTSTKPYILPGCESLTEESSYCMVVEAGCEPPTEGTIYCDSSKASAQMVGLDSGTTCGSAPVRAGGGASSLGWMGDYLYVCEIERGLARISLLDGSIDIAPLPCDAVTVQDNGLVVALSFGFEELGSAPWYTARFASFEDAVARNPEQVYAMAPVSRMAAHGDDLYFAWHSTDRIETASLADGATFQEIVLEDFDNWIFGMDVTDDGKLVLGSWLDTGGLHVFDAATGAFQGKLDNAFHNTIISGIECLSGGATE